MKKMKTKLTVKKEIEKKIDEFFNNKVKCQKLRMKGKGDGKDIKYKGYDFDNWHLSHVFQEAKLEQLREDAKDELIFLEKLRNNLPIDNEFNLDKRIHQLKEVIE